MKHKNILQKQPPQTSASAAQSVTVAPLTQNEADFVPSPDQVSRKAYFTYVNQGSLPGHEVQHWLDAEAELIAERNRTRVHGFHNRT